MGEILEKIQEKNVRREIGESVGPFVEFYCIGFWRMAG